MEACRQAGTPGGLRGGRRRREAGQLAVWPAGPGVMTRFLLCPGWGLGGSSRLPRGRAGGAEPGRQRACRQEAGRSQAGGHGVREPYSLASLGKMHGCSALGGQESRWGSLPPPGRGPASGAPLFGAGGPGRRPRRSSLSSPALTAAPTPAVQGSLPSWEARRGGQPAGAILPSVSAGARRGWAPFSGLGALFPHVRRPLPSQPRGCRPSASPLLPARLPGERRSPLGAAEPRGPGGVPDRVGPCDGSEEEGLPEALATRWGGVGGGDLERVTSCQPSLGTRFSHLA